MEDNKAYYLRRAEEERARAQAASSRQARVAHEELAAIFEHKALEQRGENDG